MHWSTVMEGWLDVSKLVSGGGAAKSPYEDFASAIGRDVYVDLAGWHLYLRVRGVLGLALIVALRCYMQ
jgi:hypothetical protein